MRTYRRISCCLLISSFIAATVLGQEDVVDRVREIVASFSDDPEIINEIDEIIRAHPDHPDILTLRLYRLRAMSGLSTDEEHTRSVVDEYDKLLGEAGTDSEIGYECQSDTGYLLYHYLHDYDKAYDHYKGMESHPRLSANDLETDYRRVDLYNRIAQAAHATQRFNEVEKYAKLVLAYPYLGLEDRDMYRKFFELYEEAGKIYLTDFAEDAKKLLEVEIYPSHWELFQRREAALKKLLIPEGAMEKVVSDLERDLEIAGLDEAANSQKAGHRDAGLEETEPVEEPPDVMNNTDSPPDTQKEAVVQRPFIWILSFAAGIGLIAGVIIVTRKRRR